MLLQLRAAAARRLLLVPVVREGTNDGGWSIMPVVGATGPLLLFCQKFQVHRPRDDFVMARRKTVAGVFFWHVACAAQTEGLESFFPGSFQR